MHHRLVSLRQTLFSLLLLGLVGFSVACGPGHLRTEEIYEGQRGFAIDEAAEIEDTLENRQVLDVLLQYRTAIVRKDFGALKRLISENYYDNAGTTDTTKDDYGSGELPEIFELMAQHAENIQYEIVIKGVEVRDNVAYVDYEYQYAYQFKVGESSSWDAGLDLNRLELMSEAGEWKIVSGL